MIIISKVFYPTKSVDVDASSPHPKGTKYRVSIGPENWGTSIGTVLKVQMIYNGKVSGRISPSYPLGTEDWKNVCLAVEDLQREYERTNRNRIYIPATQPKILPVSKYVALVRKIPKEKILREKDIENFFKQIYSEKNIAYADMHWPAVEENGVTTPYWRVVSNNGYVGMFDSNGMTRETRVRHLEEDGLEVVPCGVNQKSRCVKNYKDYIFDLSSLDRAWVDSIPNTDESRVEHLYKSLQSMKGTAER